MGYIDGSGDGEGSGAGWGCCAPHGDLNGDGLSAWNTQDGLENPNKAQAPGLDGVHVPGWGWGGGDID